MSKGTYQRRETASETLRHAHSQTAGQYRSTGGGLLCPACRVGRLRMESEPITGQTYEECGSCGYKARHRSGDFQSLIAIRLPPTIKKPRKQRGR
jgi:uncharacterized protein (DUF983 family)